MEIEGAGSGAAVRSALARSLSVITGGFGPSCRTRAVISSEFRDGASGMVPVLCSPALGQHLTVTEPEIHPGSGIP